MIDWNVIVTVHRDFDRAAELLRRLGTIQRTGLYNVIAMRVPDVPAFLEEIAQLPEDQHFFEIISHVVPITHKLWFTTADELERKVWNVVLGWAPQLAGKSVHVRMRHRGHKGELHGLELERRLGRALLAELARRGAPGRFALDDPDAVISIETLRDEAGLALWTRADLESYPFLRASIERGASRRPVLAPAESAPSRAMLATARAHAARTPADHPATAAEVVELLGEVEPLTVQQLLETGATFGEIAEAVSAIQDEDSPFGEVHRAPSTPGAAAVRAILEALVFECFEERAAEREIVQT